jgi:hypothetical protein
MLISQKMMRNARNGNGILVRQVTRSWNFRAMSTLPTIPLRKTLYSFVQPQDGYPTSWSEAEETSPPLVADLASSGETELRSGAVTMGKAM